MSLVAVEARRGLARRSTRVLIAIAVTLTIALAIGIFVDSRADFDPATARQVGARERQQDIDNCVASKGDGEFSADTPEQLNNVCTSAMGTVDDYVKDRRFELVELWRGGDEDGVLIATAIFLVIGALMAGAAFIGGDWRHGTVATLLTWEPRRTRVFFAKVAAVAAVAFVVGVMLQVLASLALLPSAVWRGSTDGADAEWFGELVAAILRISAIGAGAALFGYAIAMIGRNTSAAIGAAFGYFAVLEPLLRGLKPEWQRWLIGDNSTVVLMGEQFDSATFERTLIEAAVILVVYLVVLLGVSALTFARRDIGA